MSYHFTIPKSIYIGKNALADSLDELSTFGKKAFIISGQSMIKQGYMNHLIQILSEKNIKSCIYSKISGEPTDSMIRDGVDAFKKENCDFMIGFGGGSPLDAMKAIAALAANGGEITDYVGKEISGKLPKMAAIPTTAGTGSEATQFTIITDTKKDIKMLLKGRALIPDTAIIDPQFTISAPPEITAATGLDALCHAIEAYTSRKAQEFSDTFALSAVARIFENLPRVYDDGNNQDAREQMSLAALEAGIAFNNASVTIIHGMSRPIGAMFHIPHGMSNAMLMKACLSFALDGTYERFARLARKIGVAKEADSDKAASEQFIKAVEELCRTCNVPTLREYGIDQKQFEAVIEKMAKDAWDSGSPANTRKEVSILDIERIYKRIWCGSSIIQSK